jgi:Domain of unknown function (DUF5615)
MIPIQIVHKLRRLGFDVLTVQQFQGTSEPKVGLTDEQVLEIAILQRRAVLTLNGKHFRRLHHRTPSHQGILVCDESDEWTKRAKEIDEAVKDNAPLIGKLIDVPLAQECDDI